MRTRILLLALVPLLSLFGLYVFTISTTARNAINLARANTLKNATGQPRGNFGDTGQDDGDFGGAGLPRRIRQASLAPQLRETAAESAPGSGGDDSWTRSPENTRTTMTAIQQGWERGRSVFGVPSASTAPGPGNGADSTGTANASVITPAPDAGPEGNYQTEPENEDGGTSG